MKSRRIIVADDQPIFRHGLTALLSQVFTKRTKVLQAESYADTINLLQSGESADLIVCALRMADFEGFHSLGRLRQVAGKIPILVISDSDDPEDVRQSLDCGARGYVSKHERETLLKLAIQMVIEDGVYVPDWFVQDGQCEGQRREQAVRPASGSVNSIKSRFTPRELMVLQRITEGRSNKEIARHLNISESTVKIHVRSICQKSMVKNRTQAAMLASGRPDLVGVTSH